MEDEEKKRSDVPREERAEDGIMVGEDIFVKLSEEALKGAALLKMVREGEEKRTLTLSEVVSDAIMEVFNLTAMDGRIPSEIEGNRITIAVHGAKAREK